MPFDYKKEYKEFYLPPTMPTLVEVPPMNYLAVRGTGDPNDVSGEYMASIGLLYGIAFTLKMCPKAGHNIEGYFDYVVPPLEGLWDSADGSPGVDYARKDNFRWTAMIRQPDFVTADTLAWASAEAARKGKPPFPDVRLFLCEEGLCAQCMHIGAFDDEPATVARLHAFLAENGLRPEYAERRHHEIYLTDPRRTAPEKRRTVLRLPAAR